MVWKGIVLEESLENKDVLNLVRIAGSEVRPLRGDNRIVNFLKIEVGDLHKNSFLIEVMRFLRPHAFYVHICKDGEMYVVYRNALFNFRKGDSEIEKARSYGLSMGINPVQMRFEHLIDYPFHPFEGW